MNFCIFVAVLICSYCTILRAQSVEGDPVTVSRISGIKYVAPLNSLVGYSVSDTDEKYNCYRCNRYKGGGAACPETQRQIPESNVPADAPPAEMIVVGCEVCLKVFTTMYFRNKDFIADKFIFQNGKHFEEMNVTSRACIEDKKDARLLDGCITDTSVGGSIKRCYCRGDLCNSSVTSAPVSLVILAISVLVTFLSFNM